MYYVAYMLGLFKICFYKLCYSNKLKFRWLPKFTGGAIIRLSKGGSISLGKGVSCKEGVQIRSAYGYIEIGDNTGINSNTMINCREHIFIGKNVMIGQGVMIYDHNHQHKISLEMSNSGYTTAPIIIEDNVWIGSGSIILQGITIGENTIVGSGTLVNRNIPSNSIVYDKRSFTIKHRTIE